MSTDFIKNPYKVDIQLSGSKQMASLVNLYDLVFYQQGDSHTFRSDLNKGLELSHDVICHNVMTYDNQGEVILSDTAPWLKYGFDIIPVKYDLRAKHKFVSKEESNLDIDYTIPDTEAALYPNGFADFYNCSAVDPKYPWYETNNDPTTSGVFPFIPRITVGTGETGNPVLKLIENDSVFDQALSSETFKSYKQVCLNMDSAITWEVLKYFLGLDELIFKDNTKLLKYIDVLKGTYIWLRCSFFGDYVYSHDYNQELNQEANVQFTNLYVGLKDNKKYDALNIDSSESVEGDPNISENTMPVLPKTAPIVDLVSNSIIANYSTEDLTIAIGQALELSKTESRKALLTSLNPAITREAAAREAGLTPAVPQLKDHLTPPGWFDSETRLTSNDFTDKPILLPSKGNFVGDSRVISPTIDEIWLFLKHLVYGRPSDTTTNLNPNIGKILANDLNEQTTQDILPFKARQDTFLVDTKGTTKKGDALDYDFVDNQEELQIQVKKFISNANAIQYKTFEHLENLSDYVLFNASDETKALREINAISKVPVIFEDGSYDEVEVVEDGSIQFGDDNFWASRENPLSVKELELFVKMNRYNLFKLTGLLKNFAILGGLSKTNEELSAGSLYQLHKDYNFDNTDPNTLLQASKPFNEGPYAITKGDTERYGDSPLLKDSSKEFSAAEVYLAADGTWRSVREHNRMIVLTEEDELF